MNSSDTCQGTLVIHAVGTPECTDPDCVDLEYVRHFLVLDCEEVTGGCACVGEIEIRRAS